MPKLLFGSNASVEGSATSAMLTGVSRAGADGREVIPTESPERSPAASMPGTKAECRGKCRGLGADGEEKDGIWLIAVRIDRRPFLMYAELLPRDGELGARHTPGGRFHAAEASAAIDGPRHFGLSSTTANGRRLR